MGRRNPSLTAALCVSLAVHGLGLSAIAWWVVLHTTDPKLLAIDRAEVRKRTAVPPPPAEPPAPSVPKPPPPFEKPTALPKDDSGESDGHGTANRSTPGQQEMRSRQGYHQADLMRDALPPDASAFDDRKPNPAQAGEKGGSNAAATPAPSKGTYHPDFVADAAHEAQATRDLSAATPARKADGPGPLPRGAEPAEAPPPTPNGSAVAVASDQKPTPVAPKPPPREVTGRRATASDTDSVALAKADDFTFHAGKVEGRPGLKVNSVSPRWGLASESALRGMAAFHLVVGARVDAAGNVYDVEVLQSSGSGYVDNDAVEAVWAWTFEAPKDAAGHPKAMTWSILFN